MNRGSFFVSIEQKMKTNKKNFYYSLIIGGAIILSALVFKVTFDGDARNVRGASSDIVNCDAYFDPANGYTSLYEVISDLNASQADGLYKTWGLSQNTISILIITKISICKAPINWAMPQAL